MTNPLYQSYPIDPWPFEDGEVAAGQSQLRGVLDKVRAWWAPGEAANAGLVGKVHANVMSDLGQTGPGVTSAQQTPWADAAKHTVLSLTPPKLLESFTEPARRMIDGSRYSYDKGGAVETGDDQLGPMGLMTAANLPLGAAVAGRLAPKVAGEFSAVKPEPAPNLFDLQRELETKQHAVAAVQNRTRTQADIIEGLKRKENALEGEYARLGSGDPEAFSGITGEGNSGVAAKYFLQRPGQDVVPGVTRMDGSPLYSNSKEGGAIGLLGQSGRERPVYRSTDVLPIEEKVNNLGAVQDHNASLPREVRTPLADSMDLVRSHTGMGSMNYDIVPSSSPLWSSSGSSNSLGSFIAKPAQRMNALGAEVTNARLSEPLQRQGLGTKVYDQIEKDMTPVGGLVPSPRDQLSPVAQAFWQKRLGHDLFSNPSESAPLGLLSQNRAVDGLGYYSQALEAARQSRCWHSSNLLA
jgi:hypothetical protein